MELILQEIIARLQQLGQFKMIAIWNNQFEYIEDGSSYYLPLPCALIELQNNNSEQIGSYAQGSDLQITVHIGQEYYNGENHLIDENFSIFALRDAVFKKLANFQTTKSSIFVKTSEEQDFSHTNIYHYKMTFNTHWIDETAVQAEYYSGQTTNLQINK